jgi:hypothetical protein
MREAEGSDPVVAIGTETTRSDPQGRPVRPSTFLHPGVTDVKEIWTFDLTG